MTAATDNVSFINAMETKKARESFFRCSGSSVWTDEMLSQRPFADSSDLRTNAEAAWKLLSKHDWLNAFMIHPKIGDIESLRQRFASTATWAAHEQAGASTADEDTLQGLARGNDEYEKKFGFIFIVCATGKTASEMLSLLDDRLKNDPDMEFQNACNEQMKITNLRLEKLEP